MSRTACNCGRNCAERCHTVFSAKHLMALPPMTCRSVSQCYAFFKSFPTITPRPSSLPGILKIQVKRTHSDTEVLEEKLVACSHALWGQKRVWKATPSFLIGSGETERKTTLEPGTTVRRVLLRRHPVWAHVLGLMFSLCGTWGEMCFLYGLAPPKGSPRLLYVVLQ